jgi:hypothetical protein
VAPRNLLAFTCGFVDLHSPTRDIVLLNTRSSVAFLYGTCCDTVVPAVSWTSRAHWNPIQLIFVFGSVPFRIATHIVVVPSIQPPPQKAFWVPVSGPPPKQHYACATAVPGLARDLLHKHFIDGCGG